MCRSSHLVWQDPKTGVGGRAFAWCRRLFAQKIVPKLADGRLLRSEHLLGTLWYIISVPLLMVVVALFPIGNDNYANTSYQLQVRLVVLQACCQLNMQNVSPSKRLSNDLLVLISGPVAKI